MPQKGRWVNTMMTKVGPKIKITLKINLMYNWYIHEPIFDVVLLSLVKRS